MFFSSSWERGDFPHFMLRPTRDLLLSLSISWDAHRVTKRQWKKLNSSRFLVRWLGYNMRFTFPWVFVENTPHLIWIKPEPHTHSLPPWPCNGWANVFSRHQKCISRRQKMYFLLNISHSFFIVYSGCGGKIWNLPLVRFNFLRCIQERPGAAFNRQDSH